MSEFLRAVEDFQIAVSNLERARVRLDSLMQIEMDKATRTPLSDDLSALKFSTMARRAFRRIGITTVGQLCRQTADSLLDIKNFGHTALRDVRAILASKGLYLNGETSDIISQFGIEVPLKQ